MSVIWIPIEMKKLMKTWTRRPLGRSGGSQETTTEPGPETTALIERGGPGTGLAENIKVIKIMAWTMIANFQIIVAQFLLESFLFSPRLFWIFLRICDNMTKCMRLPQADPAICLLWQKKARLLLSISRAVTDWSVMAQNWELICQDENCSTLRTTIHNN